jgi:serine/threonine-protein kinase
MEFVEGVTLAQRLASGPMFWRDGLECIAQVLSALGCAHTHAVMHRHITPHNIILTPSGLAKLTGFDLAKGLKDKKLTNLGVILGDTRYMSPEQVKGQLVFDIRSDIYSVGAVLYEILTGAPLFEAKSQFDLMHAHIKVIPVPPSRINRSLPSEVDRIILKALEKEPTNRFQSPDEFRAAIASVGGAAPAPTEKVLHPREVSKTPPSELLKPPLFAEVPSWTKVTIIAAVVLIGVIVAFALRL